MKVDKILQDDQDKMQVVQQVPVKTEKHIDSIRPHKGHTLFEIDCSTGDISPVVYQSIDGLFMGEGSRKKVLIKPNCLYISCLNKKSALKKYAKWAADRITSNIKTAIDETQRP